MNAAQNRKNVSGEYEPNDEECEWPSDDEDEDDEDGENKKASYMEYLGHTFLKHILFLISIL